VKIFVAHRDNAAAYYRTVAPFSVLRYRTEHQVRVSTLNLDVVAGYDVLWLQMHADATAEIIAREFQAMGGIVVYDVDDWLFGLPASWPTYDHFYVRGTGKWKQRLYFHERMINGADIVTCTTEFLKAKLLEHFGEDKRVEVLPNCVLQGDWDTVRPAAHEMDGPVLGWFGTENHWDDWAEIAGAVERALLDVGGYLALIGAPEIVTMFSPWMASRTLVHPIVSWNRLHEIRSLIAAFDVGLAWCTDRFDTNKCRSPLKALQYGAAGVPVVAGRTVYGGIAPEFIGEAASNPAALYENLRWAMGDGLEKWREMAQAWKQEVWESHSYEKQAMKWLEVLL